MSNSLSDEELRWLVDDERVWRHARTLHERYPDLDVSGLYHTLKNFERSPEERLARGLAHARLRPQ